MFTFLLPTCTTRTIATASLDRRIVVELLEHLDVGAVLDRGVDLGAESLLHRIVQLSPDQGDLGVVRPLACICLVELPFEDG